MIDGIGNLLVGLTLALGLVQAEPVDEPPPSAVEQAVMDYECTATRAPGASDAQYEACLRTKLDALRADFGHDLSRLSASDRRTIDSLCASVGAARGRDARVKCLSSELAALRLRRNRTNPLPLGPELLASAEIAQPSDAGATPAPESSRASFFWTGVGVGLVFTAAAVASGLVVWTIKRRRAIRKCRACGEIAETGDLCNQCRHRMAETLRRETAELADEQRKADEERLRNDEFKERLRQEAARRIEEVRRVEQSRLQRLESMRKEQEDEEMLWRQREGDRQRDEDAQASQPQEFDPYAVLSVPRDAGPQEIAAAYENAKAKFDPEKTAHLSEELQNYFRRKAEAVDKAYQMLSGTPTG